MSLSLTGALLTRGMFRKHEKRHSRPWGCTHSRCYKTFGSKGDWKRHETSQHNQMETWRCHEPSEGSTINQCATLFGCQNDFKVHLRQDHAMQDNEYIDNQCKQNRLGTNCQCGFWCGFCKEIIKLDNKGLEAWDERFNHIDEHFTKQGRRINDWIPPDDDKPKGWRRRENSIGGRDASMSVDGSDFLDSEEGEYSCSKRGNFRQHKPLSPCLPHPPQYKSHNALPETQFQNAHWNVSAKPSKQLPSNWYCVRDQATKRLLHMHRLTIIR